MEQILLIAIVILGVIVLLNLVLTLALIRKVTSDSNTASQPVGLQAGEQAPPFTSETLDGKQVTLDTFAGRSVAFIFFGPDCGPCLESLPDYELLYPKAKGKGTEIILVSTDSLERTRAFVEEKRVQCPVIIAPKSNNSFMSDYKMRGTPSYTLLDPQGKIISTGHPGRQVKGWRELVSSWEAPEIALAPI